MQRGYCMVCMCDLCQSARATYEKPQEYNGMHIGSRVIINASYESFNNRQGKITEFFEDDLHMYARVIFDDGVEFTFNADNELTL